MSGPIMTLEKDEITGKWIVTSCDEKYEEYKDLIEINMDAMEENKIEEIEYIKRTNVLFKKGRKKGATKLKEEDIKSIKTNYKNGMKVSEIMSKYGICETTAYRYIKNDRAKQKVLT